MICKICGQDFIPSRYRRTKQEVCSQESCQYQRQLNNMKRWRMENPDYFKSTPYDQQTSKKWRVNHSGYLKQYRATHKKEHRDYMRKYMTERRNKLRIRRDYGKAS